VKRFKVTIEGPGGWQDLQDIELARAPVVGDAIETRYGTCIVTEVDSAPDTENYSGKIICRLP
jgi:hypothetical protein